MHSKVIEWLEKVLESEKMLLVSSEKIVPITATAKISRGLLGKLEGPFEVQRQITDLMVLDLAHSLASRGLVFRERTDSPTDDLITYTQTVKLVKP